MSNFDNQARRYNLMIHRITYQLIILSIIFCCNSYGQAFDSIKAFSVQKNQSINNTQSYHSLDSLLQSYNVTSFEEAELIIIKSLSKARGSNDSLGLANTLYFLGVVLQNKGDNQKSFKSFLESYNYFKSLNNSFGVALTMNHIGAIYRYYGRTEKSLEFHSMAYHILKEQGDPHNTISVLINLGIINRQLGNTERALDFNKQALSMAIASESSYLSAAKVTLGSYYWYQQMNDSALYYYNSALNIEPKTLNQKERHCAALNNIGNVHRSLKQYDSAMYYYNLAIDESKMYKTKNLESIILKNLGRTYLLQGKYNSSLDSFEESLRIATKNNLKKTVLDNYFWLSELSRVQNDHQNALINYKKYSNIKDSIFIENQINEINQLQVDFMIEKEAKEKAMGMQKIAEQNLLIKNKENLNIIFLASILLLAASAIFIFVQYKTKIKNVK